MRCLAFLPLLLVAQGAAQSPPLDRCGQPGGPCGPQCPAASANCTAGNYCAGPAESPEAWPTCRTVPSPGGQLRGRCCPVELLTEEQARLNNATFPSPFCWGPDVLCRAPRGSVADSECIPLPTTASCGTPGKICCPSFYHEDVDKPGRVPPICSTGAYCGGDNDTCIDNPPECGREGQGCCIVSTPSTTTTWCRQAGLWCDDQGPQADPSCNACTGMCRPCPQPPPEELQWRCTHPMSEDFSLPSAN